MRCFAMLRTFVLGLAPLAAIVAPVDVSAAGLASDWVNGHNSRARVLAGRVAGADGVSPYAFIEIEMQVGWKTYWRTPGDSGGVPPQFDWSKSENIADMKVLYPAPTRFKEETGDSVGYLDRVMFPIALQARDPSRPIGVAIVLEYGVCKDICIPAEARLAIEIAPGTDELVPADARDTLDRVPRTGDRARGDDPRLLTATSDTREGKQRIVMTVEFPGDASAGEAFVEAPDGIYLPLPTRVRNAAEGPVTFEVELGPYVDLKEIAGKKLTLTLVGELGQSETTFALKGIP